MSLFVVVALSVLPSAQGLEAPRLGSPRSASSSLAWQDFDRDGLEDVYVVRPGSPDRLLRNLGNGAFEEVRLDLAGGARFSRAAQWGDFDGDGWADLLLSASLGGPRLYRNLGGGSFEERTSAAGLGALGNGADARALDYDGDGRLDLAFEGVGEAWLLHNLGGGCFAPVDLGGAGVGALPLAPTSSRIPVPAASPAAADGGEETTGRAPLVRAPTAGALAGRRVEELVAAPTGPTPGHSSIQVAGAVPSNYMILGDTLVAPAGYTSTGILVKPDSWLLRSSMSVGRYGCGTAVVGTKVYVSGGSNGSGFQSLNEEYDAATDTWSTKASMAAARTVLASATISGKVYAIGGQDNSGLLGTVEEYDPNTDTWTPRAAMPTPRGAHVAVAVGGRIYAIGGVTNSGPTSVVEEYDPVGNSWATKAPMASPRGYMAAAAHNGKIYVAGGLDNSGLLATVAEYDPGTDTWTPKASLPDPRGLAAAATLNGRIYVAGGQNASTVLASVERYDPGTDTWVTQADLRRAREFEGLVQANGKLYSLGGISAATLSSVEEYDPTLLWAHRKN